MQLKIYQFLEHKDLVKKMIPISIIMFLLTFGEGIIVPIFSIFVNNITNDLFLTGIILSMLGVIGVLFSIPLGIITDKYDVKKIILFCLFGYILVPVFYILSFDFLTLLGARVYMSIINTLLWCVVWTYTFKILDQQYKTEEISLTSVFIYAGSAFSFVIGGFLATLYFNLPFYVLGIFSFIAGIFALVMLPSSQKIGEINSFGYMLKKDFKILIELFKKYKTTLFILITTYSIMSAIWGFLPVLLELNGFPLFAIGILIFIGFLPIVFLDIPLGEYVVRIGKKKGIVLCLLMLGLAALILSYSFNIYLVIITMILLAVADALALVSVSAVTSDLSIDEDRGLLAGVRKFIMSVGIAFGPILAGAVFDVTGISTTLSLIGFFAISASTFYLFLKGEAI